MSRTGFAVLMVGIAVALLALMWLGWRRRTNRDSGIGLAALTLTGVTIGEFFGVQYVSTTALGRAFDRVAISGLRYKGLAGLSVHTDGVIISVTGEAPVTIPTADVIGTSRSNGRVGKAVEAGGISVLEWRAADAGELESGFRFASPHEQREFESAIAQLTTQPNLQTTATARPAAANSSIHLSDTTQEDA